MTPTIGGASESTQQLIDRAKALSMDDQNRIIEALLFEPAADGSAWSDEIARRLDVADSIPAVGLSREESEKAIRETLRTIGFEL